MPTREEMETFKREHAVDWVIAKNAYLIIKDTPDMSKDELKELIEEHVDKRFYDEVVSKHIKD